MENKKIFVFAVVLVLLVSMAGIAMAKNLDKTNVAIKKLSVSDKVDDTYWITVVLENKFGHGDARVSYGMSIEGPSGGSGFGVCCIVLEPKSKKGIGHVFVRPMINPEPGEYTITASVSPQDKTDVNPRDNTKTITFTVD